MSLELKDNHLEDFETTPEPHSSIEEMRARQESVTSKVEKMSEGVERLIESLPQEERGAFLERLAGLRESTTQQLKLTEASAVLAVAMNKEILAESAVEAGAEDTTDVQTPPESKDPAVQTETTPEVITSSENTPDRGNISRTETEIIIDAAKEALASEMGKRVQGFKDNVEVLKDGKAETQGKIDAALDITSGLPGKLLGKLATPLAIITHLNELQKALNDPKKSKDDVAEQVGRIALDLATKGFGTAVFDFLKGRVEAFNKEDAERVANGLPPLTQPRVQP